MVQLTPQERQQLLDVLTQVPELASPESRHEVLELAGLGALAPHINLNGSVFVAVSQIVTYLSKYGRLTRDEEALGLFLNIIKSLSGIEHQEFLGKLLRRHSMMTPISDMPTIRDWRGTDTADEIKEKIIVSNTLRPIAFLAQGLEASRAVALLEVRDASAQWSGTGFLVAPDLLITNQHIISHAALLPATVFRFNYENDLYGNAKEHSDYHARAGGLIHMNAELDYALMELDGRPGNDWGWLTISQKALRPGDRVNIIQHPGGQPKQIALQSNYVEYVGGGVVQYVTPTLPGSSGSPVLNDSWEVCALHHAGGTLQEPTSGNFYFRNEGILMSDIIADLPQSLLGQLTVTKGL